MKVKLVGLVAGAALTVALAGSASADGMAGRSYKDVPETPVASWDGLYIGAAVGYSIATTDLSADKQWCSDGCSQPKSIFDANGLSSDGVQGTLMVGLDREIRPGFLVGIFGDYTFGDLKNDTSIKGLTHYGSAKLSTEIGDSWSIGARAGLVRGTTLWYAFAGYTEADMNWSVATEHSKKSGGETLQGYFLGLGVEQQLFRNVSLKLEYRYTDYDDVSYGYDKYNGHKKYTFDADTDVHSVRLGVNIKFDPFHRAAEPTPLK